MTQPLGTQSPGWAPFLDVLSSGSGPRLALNKEVLVLGRAETCDLRFDNIQLDPTHAQIRTEGGVVVVEDLGSALGTFVNGTAVTEPTELRPGDVITLADVVLRFETAPGRTLQQLGPPLPGSGDDHEQPDGIGGYVEALMRRRAQMIRAAERTRRRSRKVIWVGAVIFALGCLIFGVGAVAYMGLLEGLFERFGQPADVFGFEVGGTLSGHIGWAVAAVGFAVMLVGVGLHLLARWRARRVDRQIPPPTWEAE